MTVRDLKFQIPIVFHPIYSQLNLPRNHRFPIEKYQALFDRTLHCYPGEFKVHQVAQPVHVETLKSVHCPDYISSFVSGSIAEKSMKRIGFPWTEQFVKRTRYAVAGTIKTAQLAAKHGIALNMTGGYHHAHPDFGSGFCVFNDLALAAKQLLESDKASRILIFDCDVHQGDGTATCCDSDSRIYTVSIHCEKNFPARKQQSDWDIGVDKHLEDDAYLTIVKDTLDTAIAAFKPDFIIYDAGIDIHQDDDLGLINVSTDGIYERDKYVFESAINSNTPVMAVIGGGYQRDIKALTDVHQQLPRAARDVFLSIDR